MNRVKFLVFALVALGLFAWSLKLAPTLGADRNTQDASIALAGAPATVALKLEARRSELQGAALRLGASTALTNPGPKAVKVEPPTAERFNAVRAAATDGQSDGFKAGLVVVVSNEAGALVAQGAAEPAAPPEGFDVAAVTAAGGAGAVVTLFGAPHLVYALPLQVSDKNEVKPAGVAAVGVPLLPDAKTFFTGVRAELRLASVALVGDGKVLALDGDKAAVEGLVKSLKPGPITPVNEGALESLGPLSLPMMSDLTQQLAIRRAIAGTPYEVIATVSSADGLVALAGFQKFGLGALLGLLLLSIAVTALIKGEEEGASMVMPPPMPAPNMGRVSGIIPVPTGSAAPLDAPAEPPHSAPEASPDDFDFPASPQPPPKPATSQAPAFQPPPEPDEPASDPFASLEPAPPPAPPAPAAPTFPTSRPPPPVQTSNQPAFQPTPMQAPPPPPPGGRTTAPVSNPFDDEEGARTMAYPVFKPPPGAKPSAPPPGMDPFAMASAQLSPEEQGGGEGDYNPDATRVAAVPAELIKAARQTSSGATGERPALSPKVTSAAAPRVSSVIGGGATDEERHFQDVFKEFVATREKCKEPADGLTYDKFKSKLLKNKEQLVQKYNCKSVRFQVYVKDGKAALKATPVKD